MKTLTKGKREPTVQENVFSNDTYTRAWYPKYIKNSYDSTPGMQTNQLKMGKLWNVFFEDNGSTACGKDSWCVDREENWKFGSKTM